VRECQHLFVGGLKTILAKFVAIYTTQLTQINRKRVNKNLTMSARSEIYWCCSKWD